ncbi:MAG: helix-turn-helix domain-containing protein [Candidatus Bathyarchaeia archaeon]
MVNPSQLRFGKEIEKLQISDIVSLIQNKIDESQNLEYKEPSLDLNKDCNNLAETISGFLNTSGGILVYGVSERREGDHRYPTGIKWCNTAKERLENLMKSKIQPWEEKIKIHRIEKKESEQDGIFVMEVPKSNNPPHMYNYRYYQRLNFQTQPMTHQNVLRAFQTSWLRGRDLYQNVIEPLYSEIKLNCQRIENFEQGVDSQYQGITLHDRYLYDLVELSLQKRIDEFYRRMDELNSKLGYWAHKVATKIINEELSRIFDEHRDWIENHMENDNLLISVTVKDPSGSIKVVGNNTINGALLQRTAVKSYLQSQYKYGEVVKFEPVLHLSEDHKISDSDFTDLWESCRSKAAKNKIYLSIWDEIPKLVAMGGEILGLMLAR